MTQSILSIDKLSISIGGSRILRDVSLELGANHVFCVMGRNGVGKTTTLKSVLGLYKPNRRSREAASHGMMPTAQ